MYLFPRFAVFLLILLFVCEVKAQCNTGSVSTVSSQQVTANQALALQQAAILQASQLQAQPVTSTRTFTRTRTLGAVTQVAPTQFVSAPTPAPVCISCQQGQAAPPPPTLVLTAPGTAGQAAPPGRYVSRASEPVRLAQR